MIKKWVLKAIVQKVISFLPFGHKLNYVFQKYVTKGVYLNDEYFYDRLEHGKEHLNAYASFNQGRLPQTALELGTGWYPVVPFLFFLCGVERVYSVDITFLTSKERVLTTLKRIQECHAQGKLAAYGHVLPERWKVLEEVVSQSDSLSLVDILNHFNLVYLVEDARALSLESNSIDLVNSNNTFEHIYPVILKDILKDFQRVVKKQSGVQSHFIDMSDHFAHLDKTISMYNFLRFSDWAWKWIDNSIQPQSRLRLSEYLQMYQSLGIRVDQMHTRPGKPELVNKVKLDKKYADFTQDDLAVSHCHLISRA